MLDNLKDKSILWITLSIEMIYAQVYPKNFQKKARCKPGFKKQGFGLRLLCCSQLELGIGNFSLERLGIRRVGW
jgi:hypothetical protein